MTRDQIILLPLSGIVVALLFRGRFRYDLLAFSVLLAAVAPDVAPTWAAAVVLGPVGHGSGDCRGMGLPPPEILILAVSIPTILIVWPL